MVAGSNGHITFSTGALNEIFKYSQGIPRLINLVCDRTLLAGYAGQSNHLDKKMVKKGIESFGKQGVPSANSFKNRKALFLGTLALLLGCIYLIVFQYKTLYPTSSNSTSTDESTSRTAQLVFYPIHTASTDDSTSSSHPYSIQISSYQDNKWALIEVNQLRKFGYEAFITKKDIHGKGIWYRVMSGKFRIKGEAQAMLKKIKALKDFSDARIVED